MDEITSTPDLLQDIANEFQYEYAGTGQRFVNFIVDYIVFAGIVFLIGAFIGLTYVNRGEFNPGEPVITPVANFFLSISVFIICYTCIEFFGKGRSLGKLLTGTRALRSDGAYLGFTDALLRSLCRLIPFEVFSGFGGHPWHDKITNTMVVKERR